MNKLIGGAWLGLFSFELYSRFIGKLLGRWVESLDDVLMIVFLASLPLLVVRNPTLYGRGAFVSFVILFLWCCASALLNDVPVLVLLVQLRSYFIFVPIYFVLRGVCFGEQDVRGLIRGVVFVIFPVVLSSYVEYILGVTIFVTEDRYGNPLVQDQFFRTFTIIGNPIDYANIASLVFLVIFSASVSGFNIFPAVVQYIIGFLIFLSLFFAGSRGPIIAVLVSLVFTLLFFRRISVWNFVLGAVPVFGMVGIFGGAVISRLSSLNPSDLAEDAYRFLFFVKSLDVLVDNILFGVGPGRFGGWVSINYEVSPIYNRYGFTTDGISSIDMFWPHVWGELGVIGFFAYVLFVCKLARLGEGGGGYSGGSVFENFSSTFLLAGIIFLVAIGFFSVSLETQLIQVAFLGLFGLCANYVGGRSGTRLVENE